MSDNKCVSVYRGILESSLGQEGDESWEVPRVEWVSFRLLG